MKSNIDERWYDAFRDAPDGKSKIATSSEDSSSGLRVDQASSTVIYLGEGLFGALTSEAKWKIKKINLESGVVITAASETYNQIWDNRASLTYV